MQFGILHNFHKEMPQSRIDTMEVFEGYNRDITPKLTKNINARCKTKNPPRPDEGTGGLVQMNDSGRIGATQSFLLLGASGRAHS
jgi:hypothetical protein